MERQRRMGIRHVAWSIVMALAPALMSGSDETVHLRYGEITQNFGVYDRASVRSCAQRIPAGGVCRVDSVSVWTTGSRGSTCVVRLLADEGGGSIPRPMADRCPPVTICKTTDGVERLSLVFASGFEDADQFFVVFDSLRGDMGILTGEQRVSDTCACPTETFGNQCLRGIQGQWRTAPYAFLTDITLTRRPVRPSLSFRADTVSGMQQGARQAPAGMRLAQGNTYLVLADLDGDGRTDVLTQRGFFRQSAPEGRRLRFDTVAGSPAIAGYLPAVIPLPEAAGARAVAIPAAGMTDSLRAATAAVFGRMNTAVIFLDEIDLESVTASGYHYDSTTGTTHLAVAGNRHGRAMVYVATLAAGAVHATAPVAAPFTDAPLISAQVADVDADGVLDLVYAVATDSAHSRTQILRSLGTAAMTTDTIGMPYLAPMTHPVQFSHGMSMPARPAAMLVAASVQADDAGRLPQRQSLYRYDGDGRTDRIMDLETGWRDRVARIAYRDLGGDGHDDVLLLSPDTCRSIAVYEQARSGPWQRVRGSGLEALSGCTDVAWGDLDGDGRIDVVGVRGGVVLAMINTSARSLDRSLSMASADAAGRASSVRGHGRNVYDDARILRPQVTGNDLPQGTLSGQEHQPAGPQLHIGSIVRSVLEIRGEGMDVTGIRVYDLQGNLLAMHRPASQGATQTITLESMGLGQLASGTYRALVETTAGMFSERFVKVH